MLIYEDNAPTSRKIRLEAYKDEVTMSLRDKGPACEMVAGDDEYEQEVSCKLSDLEEALGIKGAEKVIKHLAGIFNTVDSVDRFEELLIGNGIKWSYFFG